RRLHTRFSRDWSSDVCSSDLNIKRGLNIFLRRYWGSFFTIPCVLSSSSWPPHPYLNPIAASYPLMPSEDLTCFLFQEEALSWYYWKEKQDGDRKSTRLNSSHV